MPRGYKSERVERQRRMCGACKGGSLYLRGVAIASRQGSLVSDVN